MKKKKKLIGTVVSLVLAIALMGFGVYAATSVSGKVQSSVSFVSKDVKCTFSVDVDGGKYLSGGVGTNEQEYRHKTQSVNNESVNAAHTLDEFVMGHYTFDPTTEAGKKITYTITITNDGNNEISVKYTADKKIETIVNILLVTETNMQSVETVAVGGSYIGKIELTLLDSSADIALKDIDITYEVSKATPLAPTPLTSFTFGTPSNGTVSLSKFNGTETKVVIPNKDESGNLITSIGNNAFRDCRSLTSVTIPYGVTIIGGSAFSSCGRLATIAIPSSVTSIGYGAFEYTAWYNNQPEGIVYAGKVLYTYKGTCPAVINNIKTDTVAIANYAFKSCFTLTSVSIPNSVTSIGNYAFQSCFTLTSVTIPDSVTSIGGYAFDGCSALTGVTIPNSVTSIGGFTFSGCSALTSVTIPNSVTSIGNYAFKECDKLTEINLPNNLCILENCTFYGCKSLKSISIPSSVNSIGESVFIYCQNLVTIFFFRDSPYTNLNNNWYTYLNEKCSLFFKNDTVKETFNVPNTMPKRTITPASSFTFSSPINGEITIVDYNGNYSDVVIPKAYEGGFNIVGIGDRAFYGNESIKTIYIPNTLKTIGSAAFCDNHNLSELIIPDSVTFIDNGAFANCFALESVIVPGNVKLTDTTFGYCSSLKNVTLGEGLTEIVAYMFDGCAKLSSITIPESVKKIEYNAFNNSGLLSVTIPAGVEEIGESIFGGCTLLKNVTLGEGLKEISASMFAGCVKLSSITIPETVKKIGYSAFSNSGLSSVTIPAGVEEIGDYAFANCSSLYDVTLSEGLKEISPSMFYGCTGLNSITIPESVKKIGYSAFDGSGLSSVTIPAGVEEIGDSAFANCSYLFSIDINRTTEFKSLGSVFYNIRSDGTIYFKSQIVMDQFVSGGHFDSYSIAYELS